MINKMKKSPVRLTIGYGFWSDDWSGEVIQRFEKSRYEYIDISDNVGTGRMSKRMAENFVLFLKNALISGAIPVAGLSGGWKGKKGDGRVGIASGEMLENIQAFRTNLAGERKHKGYVVSIKEKKMTTRTTYNYSTGAEEEETFPLWYKLSWLEYGTKHQPERPIVARGFEMFVAQGWVKRVVEDMITRGIGKTELKRQSYGG